MANRRRVVDHIVDYLAARGVDTSSASTAPISRTSTTPRTSATDITAVLAKHEFSAATMADGYSRASRRAGRGGGDIGRRIAESGCGLGRVVHQSGSGAGAGRPAAHHARRARQLSGHQRPQRLARAEALFSAVSVYCRRVLTRPTSSPRCPRRSRPPAPAGPRCCCCRRTFSRARSTSTAPSPTEVADVAAPGDPHPIAPCAATRARSGHDHRRRAGRPRRCARRTGGAACGAARPGRDRARRQGCQRLARPGRVVVAGRDRRDGPSRSGRRGPQQRGVPAGGHPDVGDRTGRPGRGAGRGADAVDRVGGAVPALHPHPHRRPARVAVPTHRGADRSRPAAGPARARPDAAHRAAAARPPRRRASATATP